MEHKTGNVSRNIKARLRNYCCHGKTIIITYLCARVRMRVCVCVFVWVDAGARACAWARVALLIQHATRGYIIICDLCS
jgi:hypothetical protein